MTIAVTFPPAPNVITVWLALPLENWNGRFLGLGGGGWIPGFPDALDAGVSLGFATVITNAGRPYDLSAPAATLGAMVGRNDFLRDANGRLDWNELRNFAYRGVHEMTVLGKTVTAQFYGRESRYSYFSGCSTGGRQGQSEAQRYPSDYNGVLSGSPAINWAHFAVADSWALTVTKELGPVAQCKFDVARRAAVTACDPDDGVLDGIVSGACSFDARSLIGRHTDCGVIDANDAEVIKRIWDGPQRRDGSRLWVGIDRTALIHSPSPIDIERAKATYRHPALASDTDEPTRFRSACTSGIEYRHVRNGGVTNMSCLSTPAYFVRTWLNRSQALKRMSLQRKRWRYHSH